MPASKRKPSPETKPDAKRGRGRPTKLKRETLKAIADAVRCGVPIIRACQSEGVHRDSYYAWRAQGDADRAVGKRSIHAEFSDTVRACEAKGEVGFWAAVALGVKTGKREHVAAGKLALSALRTRWAKRYHQEGRGRAAGSEDGAGGDETPTPPAPPLDLGRLELGEVRELRRLLKKARGGG